MNHEKADVNGELLRTNFAYDRSQLASSNPGPNPPP